MSKLKKIDLSTVVIKRTYAVSKNGCRFLSGVDILTTESSKNSDCFIRKIHDRKSAVGYRHRY